MPRGFGSQGLGRRDRDHAIAVAPVGNRLRGSTHAVRRIDGKRAGPRKFYAANLYDRKAVQINLNLILHRLRRRRL